MVRGRRPEHSREKILEIGAELFTRNGYHATGLKEILDACQVSKGSFYNFFESKEHFAVEIIEHYQSMELERWDEQLENFQGSHLDRIEQLLAAEIERFGDDMETCGCLLANLSGEVSQASEKFRDAVQRSAEKVLQLIERDMRICQQEGSVRTDISARKLAEAAWHNWQGALLRSKALNSLAPLHDHREIFLKLIKANSNG